MAQEYDPKLDDGQQLVVWENPEQGLVVADPQAQQPGQQQPGQQPNQEQPQQPGQGGVVYDEGQYMDDLENFVAKCTSLDDFYRYARMFNVRMRNVPGIDALRAKLNQYESEVSTMANEHNLNTVNQSGYENQQLDNSKQIKQAREKFQPLLQEIKQVMHENWTHPGVQRTAEKTQDILSNYTGFNRAKARDSAPENPDVYAGPGAGQKERQQAVSAIYQYLNAVKDQADNKYVSAVSDAKSKEEFYRRSYNRIIANIAKGADKEFANTIPGYDEQKFGPYGSDEGMRKYCQELDGFLKGEAEKGNVSLSVKTASRMGSGTKRVQTANNLNSLVSDLNEMLRDPAYDENARTNLMKQVSLRLNKLRVDAPPVNQNTNLAGWVAELGEELQKCLGEDRLVNYAQGALNTFCKDGREQLSMATKIESLRDHYNVLHGTLNRNFSREFETVYDSMKRALKNVTDGEPMTEMQTESIVNGAVDYCMRKVNQNKSSYDEMEASRLGNVIETLKALDPDKGKLMEETFGMKVVGTGAEKSYTFRKIPENLLQKPEGAKKVTLGGLRKNVERAHEKQAGNQNGPEMTRLSDIASIALKGVKDADPALMRSSPEYRAFRKASQTLADQLANVAKHQAQGLQISKELKEGILESTKAVRDAANAYRDYKKGSGRITENGMKRIHASERSIRDVEMIEDELRASFIKKDFETDPKAAIQDEIEFLKNNRAASDDNIAKMIFLKTAEKAINDGKNAKNFAEILSDPAKLQAHITEIKDGRAFRRAADEFYKAKKMSEINPDKLLFDYHKEINTQKMREQVNEEVQQTYQAKQNEFTNAPRQSEGPQTGGPTA